MEKIENSITNKGEIINKVREQLADEWEELVTGREKFSDAELGYVELIRSGQKVPKANRWLRETLIRIAQDNRLRPDEISELENEILE